MTSQQAPSLFEQIRKSDDNGNEFWSARDLAKVLEYTAATPATSSSRMQILQKKWLHWDRPFGKRRV